MNCSSRREQPRKLTATDSLWLNFATAMNNKNIDFLLANSLDSISCVDCEPNNSGTDKRVHDAEYLYMNLMPELRYLNDLTATKFSTFEDSTSIKVNYSIKSNNALEGSYNLIFILELVNGNFYLAERTFVP